MRILPAKKENKWTCGEGLASSLQKKYVIVQVRMPMESCREPIPEATYQRACVQTPEEAMMVCEKIGYPAMIKASWGGGGKGIRKVRGTQHGVRFFRQMSIMFLKP
jgi:hypothetical protein